MRGMGGGGPRSRLMGGGKLGRAGRAASGRSAGSIAAGDRIAGRPPGGMCGLVRELDLHCSGTAALGAKPGEAGPCADDLSMARGGLL